MQKNYKSTVTQDVFGNNVLVDGRAEFQRMDPLLKKTIMDFLLLGNDTTIFQSKVSPKALDLIQKELDKKTRITETKRKKIIEHFNKKMKTCEIALILELQEEKVQAVINKYRDSDKRPVDQVHQTLYSANHE